MNVGGETGLLITLLVTVNMRTSLKAASACNGPCNSTLRVLFYKSYLSYSYTCVCLMMHRLLMERQQKEGHCGENCLPHGEKGDCGSRVDGRYLTVYPFIFS